jgi:hypothetical protein
MIVQCASLLFIQLLHHGTGPELSDYALITSVKKDTVKEKSKKQPNLEELLWQAGVLAGPPE